MEKNGYWLWLQDVMVTYLNDHRLSVKIDKPVTAHVQNNGILLSLVELDLKFRRPGVAHFKRWFNIDQGIPGEGISTAKLTTDNDVRTEIYDWLVETGTIDLVRQDGFVAYERLKRDPEAMAVILNRFKRWEDKHKGVRAQLVSRASLSA